MTDSSIKWLLRSQSNQVFEAIAANGWQATDFGWQDVPGPSSRKQVSKLIHKASGYFFLFDNAIGGFYSKWSPGNETLVAEGNASGWPNQMHYFGLWLSYLRREIESPDLWAAISSEGRVLESAASADTSNIPFTAEEKAYILKGLLEVKEYLLNAHRLDPELVESRLSYLVESSERVGRKDWLNLLISVLVGIVISAALPPEVTRELFRFVGTVLSQIIRTPLLLM